MKIVTDRVTPAVSLRFAISGQRVATRIVRAIVIIFRRFRGAPLPRSTYSYSVRFSSFLLFIVVSPIFAQDAQNPARLEVDLREAPKHIFHAMLSLPVKAGPLTLVYPKWIPGEHSPTGPISDLVGLKFMANGKEIPWHRDDLDMYAFHVETPAGTEKLSVWYDYLSPAEATGSRERPSSTPKFAILNWYMVTLYPQGPKTDDLTYIATLHLPPNWKYGTALPVAHESPEAIEFAPATLTTLIDSPVISGYYLRHIDLSPGQYPPHAVHVVADGPAPLEATPSEIRALQQLVAETGALFAARHYRRYDFLLTLSDRMPPDGVEHHESSDDRTEEAYFLDTELFQSSDLLPHEFTHSWNGKYRRPVNLATPDYQTPMKGELLWVYEGLTQYYGVMLAARSGIMPPEMFREYLASTAAYLDDRPGRTWRDLQDTAIAAQILYSGSQAGSSWRRSVDFYEEGLLIWLEADTIIRRQSNGKQSLDDFCKKFYGGENTGPKIVTYTFDDVVSAMNEVVEFDWRGFFSEHLESHGPGAPLVGIQNSGWRLAFTEIPNDYEHIDEISAQVLNMQFSLGFLVHGPGGEDGDHILDVIPGSPAALAGISPGMRLVAVNGRKWSPEILRDAVRRAKNAKDAIDLLTENGEFFTAYRVDYHGGERYPHLEPISGRPDLLSEIAKMKAAPVPSPKNY
jgi:predicted metalloprotease with PDZ domain